MDDRDDREGLRGMCFLLCRTRGTLMLECVRGKLLLWPLLLVLLCRPLLLRAGPARAQPDLAKRSKLPLRSRGELLSYYYYWLVS